MKFLVLSLRKKSLHSCADPENFLSGVQSPRRGPTENFNMGGSRGGDRGSAPPPPPPPPPWNCQIINFCHVKIFHQTPSGNLDPPPTPEKIFWISACSTKTTIWQNLISAHDTVYYRGMFSLKRQIVMSIQNLSDIETRCVTELCISGHYCLLHRQSYAHQENMSV